MFCKALDRMPHAASVSHVNLKGLVEVRFFFASCRERVVTTAPAFFLFIFFDVRGVFFVCPLIKNRMTGAASRSRAARYERAETYASNGRAESAMAHFGQSSQLGPSFRFDEKTNANVQSLNGLRGDMADNQTLYLPFVLESVNGGPLEIYILRTKGEYNVFLQYTDPTVRRVHLNAVVALPGNNVDVDDAMYTNELPDEAAIQNIRKNGAVMVRRFVKYDEGVKEADVRSTRGLGMRLFGTLLAFLMRIGMCTVDTGVYVYITTGQYDGTRRERFPEDAERDRSIKALEAYFRKNSFKKLKDKESRPGFMATRVKKLLHLSLLESGATKTKRTSHSNKKKDDSGCAVQ